MKIDRLISIIFILLQKDKVTAPELAKRFEVSRRTINRDMQTFVKLVFQLLLHKEVVVEYPFLTATK